MGTKVGQDKEIAAASAADEDDAAAVNENHFGAKAGRAVR
jgi:hypothetical protein